MHGSSASRSAPRPGTLGGLRKRAARAIVSDMTGFQIKVRNLETDETLIATLDTYEDAVTWLGERPHLVEVVTVLSDVSPKQMRELKEAMRPYDEEEQGHLAKRTAQMAEALRAMREAETAHAKAEEERARDAARSADPSRPLKVRWTIEEGCANADAFDERPVSAAAERAVVAWVHERDAWVADRGQFVAEAELEVYPHEVPEGQDRVVRGGRFTPRLRGDEA